MIIPVTRHDEWIKGKCPTHAVKYGKDGRCPKCLKQFGLK